MDDIQLVLYIIFIVFAIITNVLKKKKGVPQKSAPRNTQNTSSPNKPKKQLTFEELLREFTEEQSPKHPTYEEEEQFDVNDDAEIQRIYEESVKASQKYQNYASQTDERHTGNFAHFRGYSEEDTEEEESEFAKLLQDEESAKKAIILSEILNRKY